MKTLLRILSASLLCLTLTLALSACGRPDLTGTWHGDGTLSIAGPDPTPFESAQALTLHKDGTGYVKTASGQTPLTYRYTDDTLTLSFDSRGSWGLSYRCQGNTLTLHTGSGNAVFTKVS